MILPIYAYGDPVLRRKSVDIAEDYPDLKALIDNMFETMYAANGVGLAAPQIGKNIRLFVADGSGIEQLKDSGFKKVFINPVITSQSGESWSYEEGCLSIPKIRENILRPSVVTITYYDENRTKMTETYDGLQARIIQHEYDHIEGILFTDHISTLKKQLLKGKLSDISKGKIETDYKMRFPLK
ncbi:MAG: peptide deformylase [Cytophagales bacterium]|nr:peptide deformylase [Cytophagales bacterium]